MHSIKKIRNGEEPNVSVDNTKLSPVLVPEFIYIVMSLLLIVYKSQKLINRSLICALGNNYVIICNL
jgi:hypothetical protein